jgi:hypothetical protein
MKNIIPIITASFILCTSNLINAQQLETPIEISPFIGDKLDRVERDFFNVLPALEGFEEAQFYLNPDNSLKAVIKLNKDGVLSDTVLERYSSPRRLEMLIVNNILKNIPRDENKIVSIKLKEKEEEIEKQRIYSINDSSIFTLKNSLLEDKPSHIRYGMIKETKLLNIENVLLPRYSSFDYILTSTGVGLGVGFVSGFAYGIINAKEADSNGLGGLVNFGRVVYSSAIGILIGAGVGFIAGLIIGPICSEDDKPIDPNTPAGITELEPYITFPNNIQQNE